MPFTTGLFASKLQVFFLGGAVHCVHFTSSLGSPRSHFGIPGLHFGGFWSSGAELRFWVLGSILEVSGSEKGALVGSLFAPKISKVANKSIQKAVKKKCGPRTVPKQRVFEVVEAPQAARALTHPAGRLWNQQKNQHSNNVYSRCPTFERMLTFQNKKNKKSTLCHEIWISLVRSVSS